MPPCFALVDCNNFYVSCERLFRSDLHGKAVAVLSNNDGCIIARSEEVKALGIQMATPVHQVMPLIKQHRITLFSSNYSLYGDLSNRVMSTLAGFTPHLEIYSIDESFLTLETLPTQSLEEQTQTIRRTVQRHTGIPVSIGLGYTGSFNVGIGTTETIDLTLNDSSTSSLGAYTTHASTSPTMVTIDGGYSASIDLSSLDGSNGFRLDGIDASDKSGYSVSSAGDVNNDGYDDVIIGAYAGAPNGGSSGESYVVFGKTSGWSASLDLSSLDGSNGFRLDGVGSGDRSGRSVSNAGDVNNDGYDDVIVGAYYADPNGGSSGESYVVFGKASGWSASLDLSSLDGSNGFRLDGIDGNDESGYSVSHAGDINNDGYDDVIIGAYGGDPNGSGSGESYVVFGKSSGWSASMDLSSLDGSNGFRLDGVDADDYSGRSVSNAGDVNNDGYDDVIVGSYGADPNGGASGESYVVFGKASGWSASIDLSSLDGSTGFRLDGVGSGDYSGRSVSNAGDVNNDG
ncbi:MAG TPA: hypothetical protein EYN67_08835, partial [Flavobacteriales bacterium]|nr:hypothetical protein [Flavobacteriales bacterium]